MPEQDTHILIAEDMEANRFALERMLKKSEFAGKFTFAETGDEAWRLLQENSDKYTVVLLDRMMPGMNGMDVLKQMKADKRFEHTPVIFQTAMAQNDDIAEGLSAGAYYYITKPYPEKKVFLSIIHSAVKQYKKISAIQEENAKSSKAAQLVDAFDMNIKYLHEVNLAAAYIASVFPDPQRVGPGILELLLNAVEHGNAGISYDEKTQLNNDGTWEQEVVRRLALPENADKRVSVRFERGGSCISISISDQGDGFKWPKYLQIDPKRAFDNHGRGIAIANTICFDELEYHGKGNEVRATIRL